MGSLNFSTSPLDMMPTGSPASVAVSKLETVILTLCFYAVTMMISVLGNLLVIAATYQNHTLRDSNTGLLLANLGVADALQGAISVPLRIIEIADPRINSLLCRVAIPVSILFGGSSNVAILLITIEKFVSIYWPFAHVRICKRRTIKWVISFGWSTVALFAIASATSYCWTDNISSTCRFPVYLREEYIWALYIYVHIIPITLVVFLYCFILKASCDQSRRIHEQHMAVSANTLSTQESKGNRRAVEPRPRQFRAVRVVSVVVGLFLVLVVPIISMDVAEILRAPKPPDSIIQLAVCMIYANNCVNVFVYAGFNQEYRRTFKRILRNCGRSLLNLCGDCSYFIGNQTVSQLTLHP